MNFGCGSVQPDGWVNVDKDARVEDHAFWVSDPTSPRAGMWQRIDPDGDDEDPTVPGLYQNDIRNGLGWPEGTFDYIVANHSLSDLTFHELPGALSELHRVLRPGGVLRVLVPDLYRAWGAFLAERSDWFPQGDDLTDIHERFCTFVTWFGTVGSVFTPPYLSLLLRRAGFDDVSRETPHLSTHGPLGISELDGDRTTSLIMEGVK